MNTHGSSRVPSPLDPRLVQGARVRRPRCTQLARRDAQTRGDGARHGTDAGCVPARHSATPMPTSASTNRTQIPMLPHAHCAPARVLCRSLPAANHANCPLDWPGHNHDAALLRHHVRGTRRGNKKEGAERTLDHRRLRDVAKRRRVHDVAHGVALHGLVLLKSKGEARSAFGPSTCVQPARAALRLLPSPPETQTWLCHR